jgi:hypothetical protein
MSSSLTHDVVATIGEYTDKATGQKKKRYATCGKCFTDDEGRQSIKLDVIPVAGWSGWLSLYPVEKREHRQTAEAAEEPRNRSIPSNRQAPPPVERNDEENDDIPF